MSSLSDGSGAAASWAYRLAPPALGMPWPDWMLRTVACAALSAPRRASTAAAPGAAGTSTDWTLPEPALPTPLPRRLLPVEPVPAVPPEAPVPVPDVLALGAEGA